MHESQDHATLRELVGRSEAMAYLRGRIARVAESQVPVLLVGETGTGKDVCARAIAALSRQRPFIPVNCAAIAEPLADSELFGHDRGAFTGAVRSRAGLVAQADGGILFVDELADMSSSVQAKLLRALESGEYRRLGSEVVRHSQFRIVAATSGEVEALLTSGRLREDLLHRVAALRIKLPPLRERLEDLPDLARHFLLRFANCTRSTPGQLSERAVAALAGHPWPGNLRELKNVIEAAATVAGSARHIAEVHIAEVLTTPSSPTAPTVRPLPLKETVEHAKRQAVQLALEQAGGNRERAAKFLRISPATLYRILGVGRGTPPNGASCLNVKERVSALANRPVLAGDSTY